jgi:hypothetical protein
MLVIQDTTLPCRSATAKGGRISGGLGERTRRRGVDVAPGIDRAAACLRVRRIEKTVERIRDGPRVADVGEAVREGQFLGLDPKMHGVGGAPRQGGEVVSREEVEHLQKDEAL